MINIELHIKTIEAIVSRSDEVKSLFDILKDKLGYSGLVHEEYLAERASALIGLYRAQVNHLKEDKGFDAELFVSNNKALIKKLDKCITSKQRFRGKNGVEADNAAMLTWMSVEGCFMEVLIDDCISNLDKGIDIIKESLKQDR